MHHAYDIIKSLNLKFHNFKFQAPIQDNKKLYIELNELKQSTHSGLKNISPDLKLKKYHALLARISKCSEVDKTPDELISLLRHKEY